MELCRRSTKTSLATRTAKQVPSTVLRMALWKLCPHRQLPATSTGFHVLQLFFLEEDLSVNCVGAGGCGVSPGGGRGLWPGSHQLQFCICQALLLQRMRLEEEDTVTSGNIVFEITANYKWNQYNRANKTIILIWVVIFLYILPRHFY